MKEKKDYTQEIEFIQNWCITIMDFITIKDSRFAEFANNSKDSFKNNPIENSKKILLGYQQGMKDINDIAKALKPSEYQELNNILFEKYGKKIMDFDSKTEKKIESILKRKKILNNEEYELIENEVSNLSQEDNKEKEIEALNKLLVDYQKRKL